VQQSLIYITKLHISFQGTVCPSPAELIITVKISELPLHDELQQNILMLSPSQFKSNYFPITYLSIAATPRSSIA